MSRYKTNASTLLPSSKLGPRRRLDLGVHLLLETADARGLPLRHHSFVAFSSFEIRAPQEGEFA